MQYRVHTTDRPSCTAAAIRRIATVASWACLAVLALAVPTGPYGAGLLAGTALAASGDSNAGDNGTAPGSVPGQQKMTNSEITESGELLDESTMVPVAGQGSSTPKVIKEISGVSDNTELSSEEELKAIRSGWGTWRTADGPESVVAQ